MHHECRLAWTIPLTAGIDVRSENFSTAVCLSEDTGVAAFGLQAQDPDAATMIGEPRLFADVLVVELASK